MMGVVSVKTNSGALATRQRLRGKTVDAAMKARARQWGETLKRNAEALSQGPLTASQLSQYSPGFYSTARAANPYADALINRQSGKLAGAWRVRVWSSGAALTVTVLNGASYSGFLLGTARMRKRDILGRASGQLKPFPAQMLQAKRQGERSVGDSLVMELVNVAVTVGVSYGSAGA